MILALTACSFGLDSIVAERDEGVDFDPVEASLVGRTFELDLSSITWIEPAGMGEAAETLDLTDPLVHVIDHADGEISLAMALSDGAGGQDACEPVHAFPSADFSRNPRFEVQTEGMDITLGGQPAEFQDLYLAGVFDPSGETWGRGRLSTLLDVRALSEVIGEDLDACAFAEALDGACEPCADGEEACIAIVAEDAEAWEIEVDFDPEVDGSGC